MAGANLGDAYINIIPSADGISRKITNALSGDAESAGTSLGSKIGTFAKKALASAAVAKVVVDAFKQGAALEQSIGGVETLYGESADIIKNYAKDAWQAAGISANQYMEQSTSFAAALVGSLGGDTAAAAEAANVAITDMADNSNKMGTSLDSIQQAYQGFAKQNYTMLDNLKLGYGGTKTEMERLLADASELSGKEYNIDNLSDVYEAIHVIQEDLGITGTTADEAATTLSGSFASMKAAAQDFMGNLVLGENLSESMANLATSACTFLFDNLVPAIGRVIQGIPTVAITLLQSVVPNILNKITELINKFANGDLSNAGKKAIRKFASSFVQSLPTLIAAVGKLVAAIVKAILKLPAKLVEAGKAAVKGFISGLKSLKLPKLRITWTTESKKGGGKTISIPKPHLEWYAKGGIFTNPSVIGVGEAGAEAVVPLNKLWSAIEQMGVTMASAAAVSGANNRGQTLHVTTQLGGVKVAEQIYKLNKQGQMALQG